MKWRTLTLCTTALVAVGGCDIIFGVKPANLITQNAGSGTTSGTGGTDGGMAGAGGASATGGSSPGTGGVGGAAASSSSTGTAGGGGACAAGATCATPSDCSPSPATVCLVNTCHGGCCGTAPAVKGMACSDNGGKVCDGAGHCVGCNTNADCGAYCTAGTCFDVAAIATPGGYRHSCAIVTDGSLWCWGGNVQGEVGDGTTMQRASPTNVVLPGTATAVSANGADGITSYHASTCAILADKSLWCWGDNSSGQLGVNDTATHAGPQPVKLPSSAQIIQVSVGSQHVCAVDASQELWCWGDNSNGQLGNGTTANTSSPVMVASSVASVSAGLSHTCAIGATGGALSCWGSNFDGELGNGTTSFNATPTPSVVTSLTNVLEVAAGWHATCARNATGVYCWGSNSFGQLGIGSTANQSSPSPLSLPGAKLLALGAYATGALTSAGLFMWGSNAEEQLGDGTMTDEHMPKAINFASATGLGLAYWSSCALTSAGRFYCWGTNADGQLGNGTTKASPTPTPVVWQ